MAKKLIYLFLCVLLLGVSVDITNADITSDLISYWKMDEGSGTMAKDSFGSNDGTLVGDTAWAEGWVIGSVEFDGDDDYVDCGEGTVYNTVCRDVITLAAWVKPNPEVGPAWGGIIFRGWGNQFGNIDPYDTFALYYHRPNERMGFKTNGTSPTWVASADGSATDLFDGEWHHTAAVYDGAEKVIYLDSVEILRDAATGQISVGLETGRVLIGGGRDVDPMVNEFGGRIDEARIYDRALTQEEIVAVMENIESFPYALSPDPPSGALNPETWINLSWRAGDFAVSHDVYIGDDFDAVNEGAEGTFVGNQEGTFLVVGFPGFPYPDGLIPGTTYYWRIDEVNEAEPNSPWIGPVWSFSIPPKTAYAPDPANGAESVDLNVLLSWTAGFGAKLHTVYFGDNFEEVSNATGGVARGTADYTPDALELAKTYFWRVDEFDVVETHKGDVWSFTTEGAVGSPNPANGAVDVTQTPTLTWVAGVFTDTHEVYFGADEASLELKGSGNLGSESFEPGQLEWNTTYYWRVDEANNANANSPWTGPLWSFTTANFLIIDNMESYNDLDPADPASNRIFNAWIDGFGDATNGSLVGYENPPFAEQSIVHGGSQSMPLSYENSVGKSEATLTLSSNRDWTVKGVNTLTIWFRGSSNNDPEQMYVALNGSAVVNHDNPDAVKIARWTQWDIDLKRFADQGVNLANVNSITLGLGNRANPTAGGSGMMYFDDIRLYAPLP
ncbi:MAG: LamG domain-containing protein [Planctomycetes bacterium]|nr:LamG domain-containing protein [Planctomycetota bacterium]